MRVYSLSELFNLTRRQLFELHADTAAKLPVLPEADRQTAIENLRRIQRVLAHPGNMPS